MRWAFVCFHPLKAGRRLCYSFRVVGVSSVSIPSRRVGDVDVAVCYSFRVVFPSPQGGSETLVKSVGVLNHTMFPSPQGGSETMYQRVNNLRKLNFHPLKAGRRHSSKVVVLSCLSDFHPLKAGRRLDIPIEKLLVFIISIPSRRVGDT